MALGEITSFSVQQRITLKRAFMWSAVYTMMQSSGHILLLTKASLQYWDIFMRYTMSVFNPYKVRREKQKSRPFQLENDEDIDQLSISIIIHSAVQKPHVFFAQGTNCDLGGYQRTVTYFRITGMVSYLILLRFNKRANSLLARHASVFGNFKSTIILSFHNSCGVINQATNFILWLFLPNAFHDDIISHNSVSKGLCSLFCEKMEIEESV